MPSRQPSEIAAEGDSAAAEPGRHQALAEQRHAALDSLQQRVRTDIAPTTEASSAQHEANQTQPQLCQPTSRELHEAARAAAVLRQRRPQVHPHPQHSMPAVRGDGSARDLSAIASSVDALQRKLEEHHLLGHRHMGSLGPQDLGQVAAAAAAAAAQTVRQESHAELSQVLKAVLLQQSRLGGGAAHAGASAATTPWAVHTAQDNVHVQGQLLIPPEPGTRPVASATPQVCSGMFACIATLVQVGVVHPFGKGCVPARRCHHEDVPAACCARFCVAITAGSWACRGALQQWHRIHRPKHQASQRPEK